MTDVPNSPIAHLVTNLLNSIERVAPEKASELEQLIRDGNITFEIDTDSVQKLFFASPTTSTITFGLRSLELLWARAFAYCSLYDFLSSKLLAGEDITDVELCDPVIKPAMDLLSWAVSTELQVLDGGIDDFDWPDGLPTPSREADRTTFENAADELLLVAVAAILHHEIGHITLGHDPATLDVNANGELTPSSRETLLRWEKEADAWAANWLLDGLDNSDGRFLKRVLGLSLVFAWMATRNVHTGHWLASTHPPAWDRLYQNLKQNVDTNTHPVWLFVAYILQLHLQAIGEDPTVEEVDSGEEWVNILLNKVSKAKQ